MFGVLKRDENMNRHVSLEEKFDTPTHLSVSRVFHVIKTVFKITEIGNANG